jgi:hypothetical protein
MFCGNCGDQQTQNAQGNVNGAAFPPQAQQPMQQGYQQPIQQGYQQPMQQGYQQPMQQGYQQPMQQGYQQPMQQYNNVETSGLATAALICAFFIPIVGLILGIVGLTKYKTEALRKKCVTAIALSVAVWVASFAILLGLSAF